MALDGRQGGSTTSIGDPITIGVVTVSDRASSGEYQDAGGPAIAQFFEAVLESPWTLKYALVADEQQLIEEALKSLVANGCSLVVTTGGTGPAPRDVTPEATEAVCTKMLPGFGEQMRAISLKYVPTAILSRQTAGIRDKTLILNLPGNPKSIREILDKVFAAVPYCVDLVGGPYMQTRAVDGVVDAFRPKKDRRAAPP